MKTHQEITQETKTYVSELPPQLIEHFRDYKVHVGRVSLLGFTDYLEEKLGN